MGLKVEQSLLFSGSLGLTYMGQDGAVKGSQCPFISLDQETKAISPWIRKDRQLNLQTDNISFQLLLNSVVTPANQELLKQIYQRMKLNYPIGFMTFCSFHILRN